MHPGDLKNSVGSAIDRLLAPIISKFSSPELQELTENAYPTKKAAVVNKKGIEPCYLNKN